MANFFARLFCKHTFDIFVRNIYGDEIIHTNKRSIWQCSKCNAHTGKDKLHQP